MKATITTIVYFGVALVSAWMPSTAEAFKIKIEPSLIFQQSHTRVCHERVPLRRVYPTPVRVVRPPMQPPSHCYVYPYFDPVTGCVEYLCEPCPLPRPIPALLPANHYHTESQQLDLNLKFR